MRKLWAILISLICMICVFGVFACKQEGFIFFLAFFIPTMPFMVISNIEMWRRRSDVATFAFAVVAFFLAFSDPYTLNATASIFALVAAIIAFHFRKLYWLASACFYGSPVMAVIIYF